MLYKDEIYKYVNDYNGIIENIEIKSTYKIDVNETKEIKFIIIFGYKWRIRNYKK